MSEKIETSLMKAIFEVFETMFFLCPDDEAVTDSSADEGDEKICVKIDSSGKLNISLWLIFSETLLRIIAPSLFDRAREDFEEKELMDLACEAANMIGGALLNFIDPERQDILNLPQIMEGDASYDTANLVQQYDIDDEKLRVYMRY